MKAEIAEPAPQKEFTVGLEVQGNPKEPARSYPKAHSGKPAKGKAKRDGSS